MMLRFKTGTARTLVVFSAFLLAFLFLFAKQASHSPDLHGKALLVSQSVHSHDHGDHSHDDWDVADETSDETDHHHADHTHDKAGLVVVAHVLPPATRSSSRPMADLNLPGGPLYGIDRPPRSMT